MWFIFCMSYVLYFGCKLMLIIAVDFFDLGNAGLMLLM